MDKEKTLRKLKQEIEEVRARYGVDPFELIGVVRCEECRYNNTDGCNTGCGWCECLNRGVLNRHFCGYGERRDSR
jgi:hypothetical protein